MKTRNNTSGKPPADLCCPYCGHVGQPTRAGNCPKCLRESSAAFRMLDKKALLALAEHYRRTLPERPDVAADMERRASYVS